MVRGEAEYILSDKAATELRRQNPIHPQIARSAAAGLAIAEILCQFNPPTYGARLSPYNSPPFMKELINRYNNTFLSGPSDLKLGRRNLWRIFFRRQYGRNYF